MRWLRGSRGAGAGHAVSSASRGEAVLCCGCSSADRRRARSRGSQGWGLTGLLMYRPATVWLARAEAASAREQRQHCLRVGLGRARVHACCLRLSDEAWDTWPFNG